jgi:transmembrane sensor
MNKTKFRKLCVKAITGNIDEAEKRELDKLLAQSNESRIEFEKVKSVWERSATNKNLELPDIDVEWESLNKRIRLSEKKNEKESIFNKIIVFTKSLFTPMWKPAFAGLFIAIISVTILLLSSKEEIARYKTISTLNNDRQTVQLPDGSMVKLNSGSSIEFPKIFKDGKREVKLGGEALFSVTKNGKPFVIITENARITVLGTEFNVWTRDEKTKVIVKNGRVNLEQIKAKNENVILSKNQESIIIKNSKPSPPKNVNADYLLGWLDNKLVFNRTPLNEIAGELERFYNVKIKLVDNGLKNLTLTGSFKNQKVDSVMNMICLALNLKFIKTDKKQNNQVDSYLIDFK